jgi:hypothetical protein
MIISRFMRKGTSQFILLLLYINNRNVIYMVEKMSLIALLGFTKFSWHLTYLEGIPIHFSSYYKFYVCMKQSHQRITYFDQKFLAPMELFFLNYISLLCPET